MERVGSEKVDVVGLLLQQLNHMTHVTQTINLYTITEFMIIICTVYIYIWYYNYVCKYYVSSSIHMLLCWQEVTSLIRKEHTLVK